ncbi:hypothetical protein SAMN05421543_101460 [Alicyclobacillus macrosporangiidus]|uniref:Uncharacterized protein n=1 Tax=Alicyclobacillus macrosporangiidus TaxID=392015 RepID=A0A1I7FUH5_9BACL|nr:hypothetical protein SAMN05421543_101460 [Alicyclobacillus macrosporangiidus]
MVKVMKRNSEQASFLDDLFEPSDEPDLPKRQRAEHRRAERPSETRSGICRKCGAGRFSLAIVAGTWYRTCEACRDRTVI